MSYSPSNPNACWDWWGYTEEWGVGKKYDTNQGPQPKAIVAMVEDLAKGSLPFQRVSSHCGNESPIIINNGSEASSPLLHSQRPSRAHSPPDVSFEDGMGRIRIQCCHYPRVVGSLSKRVGQLRVPQGSSSLNRWPQDLLNECHPQVPGQQERAASHRPIPGVESRLPIWPLHGHSSWDKTYHKIRWNRREAHWIYW